MKKIKTQQNKMFSRDEHYKTLNDMNDILRKRYDRESCFFSKPIEKRPYVGDYYILRESGGTEWLIFHEDDKNYFVFNQNIRLKSKILKHRNIVNSVRLVPGSYILNDKCDYGRNWRKRNGFEVYTVEQCAEIMRGLGFESKKEN